MNRFIQFALFLFTSSILLSCDQQKKKISYARIIRDVPITNKVNYPDGKPHLLITYQHGTLSKIEYFAHSGKYDSVAYYKRGQKNSVIYYKYDDSSNIQKLTFVDGSLLLIEKFDADNNLLYKEPVSSKKLSRSEFLLKSGNNFINRNSNDTLYITNKELPVLNRAFKFINFKPRRIGNANISEYAINKSLIKSGVQKLVVLVYLHQENERHELLDSLIIPVR